MATFVMCWNSSAGFNWVKSQGDLDPGLEDVCWSRRRPHQAALEAWSLALDKGRRWEEKHRKRPSTNLINKVLTRASKIPWTRAAAIQAYPVGGCLPSTS